MKCSNSAKAGFCFSGIRITTSSKILKDNPNITQGDIVKALEISRATVQRMMKNLKAQGKIERIGGKRYGHWEIHE